MGVTKARVKRGRAWCQQSSCAVEHGPYLPSSNVPSFMRYGPMTFKYFYYWDVELPAMPQLNKSCFSHLEAINYANRTVAALRAA